MSELWNAESYFGEPIHVYSRAQAIEDGVLVQLDKEITSEAGWKIPVACTRSVWEDFIFWNETKDGGHNDLEGRLWDVLFMGFVGACRNKENSTMFFKLDVVPRGKFEAEEITLKCVIDGGDDGVPVATIMQKDED
tara:strand:- start:181 stop:588 length:408 start_codon:yes stop_codon:yes gene_type:complete